MSSAATDGIQGPRRTLVLLAPPSPSSLPISFAPRDQVIARCPNAGTSSGPSTRASASAAWPARMEGRPMTSDCSAPWWSP
jgi:hypothetical protein